MNTSMYKYAIKMYNYTIPENSKIIDQEKFSCKVRGENENYKSNK